MAEPLTLTAWAEREGELPSRIGEERVESPTEEAVRDAVTRLVGATDASRIRIEYGAGPPISIDRYDVDAATRLVWSWAEQAAPTE